mmetsp:Transcript_25657/g.82603  ORF Transcript_25657/g.82603 Transcript_25657/m.82603 type:complete len:256 (+) Transcript_25657:713-1480(+)
MSSADTAPGAASPASAGPSASPPSPPAAPVPTASAGLSPSSAPAVPPSADADADADAIPEAVVAASVSSSDPSPCGRAPRVAPVSSSSSSSPSPPPSPSASSSIRRRCRRRPLVAPGSSGAMGRGRLRLPRARRLCVFRKSFMLKNSCSSRSEKWRWMADSSTTLRLRPILCTCWLNTLCSMVPTASSRYTYTGLGWPKRKERHMACMSMHGFQHTSYSTRRLTPSRLMPSPPARVDTRRMSTLESSQLTASMCS